MTPSDSPKSDRADRLLTALGFFESRAAARAAIEAGRVKADGRRVEKPSQTLSAQAAIEAEPVHPYVSRGGLKLAHGLVAFSVKADGRVCLDIGASTGGFTQVLLEAGASRVYAVDVGRDQLRPLLKEDPRVVSLEGMDARDLNPALIPEPPALLVCDASFIALEKLLGPPLDLAAPEAEFVGLFKPQFQVGREHVGKGGIVSDQAAVARAKNALAVWMDGTGWPVRAWTESPIAGGDGNAEYLFHARRG